jgi:hypothetical protein
MTQETKKESIKDLKAKLISFEKEFIRCVLQNSFSDSEVFLGSRHKASMMIRNVRRLLAVRSRGNHGQEI